MNYKLAKELKDKGFPYDWCRLSGTENHKFCDANYCEPTLSDLIEACGNKFRELCRGQLSEQWSATGYEDYDEIIETDWYMTSEEAVARLWIAIQEVK